MSSTQEPKKAYNLFYSYADEDKALLDKLEKHLGTLKRQGEIIGWHKRNISAGQEWEYEIDKYLNKSSIIVLLISQNFIDSDYYYSVEMNRAIKRGEDKKAIIVPIILRPCDWDGLPFSKYEVLPSNEKPVTSWRPQDEAFNDIAQGIRKVVQNLREFDEEYKANKISSNSYKSLKPHSVSPKTTPKVRSANGRERTNVQSGEISIPVSTKKTLPKRNMLTAMRKNLPKYFSSKELEKCGKGIPGLLLLLFVIIDVLGLPIISQDWLHSQELPMIVGTTSLILYIWGIFNKNFLIAILLTMAYCVTWFLVGTHYLTWHPLIILTISAIFSCVRIQFFRKHER